MPNPFIWPVRVYFEDTDAGGVVFYGNYLKFYERARTEWLRSLGIGQQFLKDEYGILFVVKNVSVEYKRSAVLDDHLQVTAEISGMRGASLEFDQAVWRGDTLLSTARTKIVCVDRNRMRPVPIPEMVAEKMLAGREHD
ncbi:tol-pal system-associated acyl-CoA thioesterase [Oxalobacter aliiformigenes]|uniref:Tol-pal system-associated acyl-CoA thioesterase n=1 Tax=Oxalobacter aliiformigenes TaxID=2946593 RepID=A0A9E9LD18_9BURK|nr:tol-pal system-associated acyl-CoA thioesterase [Oxalobacter aliiformigenes]WAV91908.1 tol-pal system-associated acyl-CoA thioesterase [Oxalobacter aliiformigenes]